MHNQETKVQSVAVPTQAPKVDAGLIVRTIIYIVAIINAGAAMFGYDFNINANEDKVYEAVTLAFSVGSFISAYWKNNNVTKAARVKAKAADQVVVKKRY